MKNVFSFLFLLLGYCVSLGVSEFVAIIYNIFESDIPYTMDWDHRVVAVSTYVFLKKCLSTFFGLFIIVRYSEMSWDSKKMLCGLISAIALYGLTRNDITGHEIGYGETFRANMLFLGITIGSLSALLLAWILALPKYQRYTSWNSLSDREKHAIREKMINHPSSVEILLKSSIYEKSKKM